MKETNGKTFDKDGMLGAWEGNRGLVVWIEGGNDGDAPVENHVQHPRLQIFHTSYSFLGSYRFLAMLSQRANVGARKSNIFECTIS